MSSFLSNVCVVEDNESIRNLIVLLLEQKDASVTAFSSGQDAIKWIVKNKPSLILTDIRLPDISGINILQAVRKMKGKDSTPTIAVTALARKGDRERYLEAGFDGYIAKPINTSFFIDEIEAFVS